MLFCLEWFIKLPFANRSYKRKFTLHVVFNQCILYLLITQQSSYLAFRYSVISLIGFLLPQLTKLLIVQHLWVEEFSSVVSALVWSALEAGSNFLSKPIIGLLSIPTSAPQLLHQRSNFLRWTYLLPNSEKCKTISFLLSFLYQLLICDRFWCLLSSKRMAVNVQYTMKTKQSGKSSDNVK